MDTIIKVHLDKSQRKGLPENIDSPSGYCRDSMGVLGIWDRKERNIVDMILLHRHEHGFLKNLICQSGHSLKITVFLDSQIS